MSLNLFGLTISRTKAAPANLRAVTSRGAGGWMRVIREPFTGAWQQNADVRIDTTLAYFAVFACTTLIASDVGKLRLRLMQQDTNGVWNETDSPAFSPVLRKPNRYQTTHKFVEQWMVSKLTYGNTYVIKERDARNVVVALYILDPTRVTPFVAPDGAVFYQLGRDDLSGVAPVDGPNVFVPSSEIIHDTMVALFHPLCGVSPIFAGALAASQGLTIQQSSDKFFANGSNPGGLLIAPTDMTDDDAADLKKKWTESFSGDNAGKVAVLSNNLKYEQLGIPANDAQLIEQLKWSAENVCSCYHVPAWMIGVGPQPPYANAEPLLQLYYSQCLQSLITNCEASLDEGLELPKPYGTEFDITDLIWMDMKTRTDAAAGAIGAGAMSPNEARRRYFDLGPVDGGESPYLQQQYYSLKALSERDSLPPTPTPAPPTPPPDLTALALTVETLLTKELAA